MKKKDLLLMAVVFMLFSCCSDESDKYGKTSALYIKSVYSISQEADARTYAEDSLVDPKERVDTGEEYNEYEIKPDSVWSTGDNIKWVNVTTGEIKFKVRPPMMRGFPNWFDQHLVVFLDDKELIRFETIFPGSSTATARPCITEESEGKVINKGCTCGREYDHIPGQSCETIWDYSGVVTHFYISKGFPRWEGPNRPDWYDEGSFFHSAREKNWKAIESEWNIFIEQLKKEGKYRE